VSVQYPDLTDYLAVAAAITGFDDRTLIVATKLDLADSALHAPSAGFGEQDGSNAAAVSADAGDVEALLTALASGPPELQAAMEKLGVLTPLVIYVEK
jgi:hypothetical protein